MLLGAATPVAAGPESPSPAGPAISPVAPTGRTPAVLDDFARAWATIVSYSATVTLFEQNGDRTQDAVFNYTFAKPSTATAYEAKGNHAGVTLVWNGGDTVVAQRAGLFSFFKKSLALHDPMATTIRGASIDQLGFGAILNHAEQAGTLSEAPGEVVAGVPTEAVTFVPASSGADDGLTREVLELSSNSHFPLRIMAYAGTQLVRKIDFTDTTIKPAPTR